jgi:hypothetical protein
LNRLTCLGFTLTCLSACWGQQFHASADTDNSAPAPTSAPAPAKNENRPAFGVAVSISTLGAGIQAATAVSRTENVRFGFNYFSFDRSFDKDGINYDGTLHLRSGEILFDQYFGKVFHISPGLMFYDGNKGNALAHVSGGQSFSLGGNSFISDPANPVNGTADIAARKYAPELMIGIGNLLPRNRHHFTANFELGVIFQGSPSASLALTGNTCAVTPLGNSCGSVANNSLVQSSIASEQTKINNSLSVFKYYPVVRLTLGYKF